MINIFYKLIVRVLIIIKYPGLALRDLFWDYEVNEHADKFLIGVEDRISSDRITVRMKIPRQEMKMKRSLFDITFMLLENLDSVLDWYIKEEKHGI